MAKISPLTPFPGSPGNFPVYRMYRIEKSVVREKHGSTKEQVLT